VGVRDKQTTIRSEDVVGVIDEDNAVWSLAHTSIRYENFDLRRPSTADLAP
jgi:hypothetical protein